MPAEEGAGGPPQDGGGGITRREVLRDAGIVGVGAAVVGAGVGIEALVTSSAPTIHGPQFLSFSATLTGFDELELQGAGTADLYVAWLAHSFPDVMGELLAAWAVVARDPDRELALERKILADPKLGPFARRVLVLWYTASWNALPASWSKAYGQHAEDVDQTFGPAYAEGLMWKAANVHPSGAKPTGFGTWALTPAS
jgi:hypothetical protein